MEVGGCKERMSRKTRKRSDRHVPTAEFCTVLLRLRLHLFSRLESCAQSLSYLNHGSKDHLAQPPGTPRSATVGPPGRPNRKPSSLVARKTHCSTVASPDEIIGGGGDEGVSDSK